MHKGLKTRAKTDWGAELNFCLLVQLECLAWFDTVKKTNYILYNLSDFCKFVVRTVFQSHIACHIKLNLE